MAAHIDQRDLSRRHPLCPACGYDLVATLAANRRRCPECGEGFELGDLRYQRRAGDWTNARAIRRAAAVFAMRFIIAFALASGFSALAIQLLNLQWPRILPFLVAAIQACAVGAACARRLIDQAGFESLLLIVGACATAALASSLGFSFAAEWIIAPRFAGIAFMHVSVALLGALVWIIHHLVVEG